MDDAKRESIIRTFSHEYAWGRRENDSWYHEGKRDIFPGRTDRRRKGARCQACCLSDEHGRYGHKKEELIDGVELGGVATFIGSGETSDISLFI